MSYKNFQKEILNEADTSGMTAAALKSAGITSVKGLGGVDVPVNGDGFLVNPAQHLPDGMLDKLKNAWSASNGDVNKFFGQNIDGTSVKDVLSSCPSQQSYGIAKELGLPEGTNVPCKTFTDNGFESIKYNPNSKTAGGADTDGTSAVNNAGAETSTGSAASSEGAGGDSATGSDASGSGADSGDIASGGDGASASGSDWWTFFGTKEFLIGAVAVGGIIALIKTLGGTIKARFRKCAKVLYRMQKDFGTKENGMDMKAVLPGVGSKIMDWTGRLFGAKTGKGKNKGALGLRPFVDNYRNELAGDYKEAKHAFDMIALAGEETNKKAGKNRNTGAINNLTGESQVPVYSSFSEMFKANPLSESEHLNESATSLILLASLAVRGGMYIYSKKDKNGNDVGKPVAIQVTTQSTREICYSILNMFCSKYFNMEQVSKKMGMDIESLGDIDASNVDKFTKLVGMMKEELSSGKTSKMFTRVEKNYNQMVDAYVRIANTVVNNFEKYTKKRKDLKGNTKELSEKDANLLAASAEKLKAEVNRQDDAYKNNFFRVVNAIITSPEYVAYIDFINEKVMPVFKTGFAGDADFVLDITPKKGEYYIIRQTNEQTSLNPGETAKGNMVLAKVLDFNNDNNSANSKIKFSRIALIKGPDGLKKNDKGEYDLAEYKEGNFDRTAFGNTRGENAETSGDNIEITYKQWISLDPVIAVNVPGDIKNDEDSYTTKLYHRVVKTEDGRELDEYIFGIATRVKESVKNKYSDDSILYEDGGAEINVEPSKQKDSSINEVPVSNDQKNIIKLACINIIKGSNLTADIKTNQCTGAYITLQNRCSAKELDSKLREIGYSAFDGKTKEKEQIEDNISKNTGSTHVSRVDLNDISAIETAIKNIETRQTTSEKLFNKLDNIADDILKDVQSLNLTADKIIYPMSLSGAIGVKSFYTCPKEKSKDPYYKKYPTGIQDKRGNEVILFYYPTLLDNAGNILMPSNPGTQGSSSGTQGSTSGTQGTTSGTTSGTQGTTTNNSNTGTQGTIGIIISIAPISVKLQTSNEISCHPAKLDKESIKNAAKETINDLVKSGVLEPVRGETIGTEKKESFTIEYDSTFNIAESYMSSFGFKGDKLHINRRIKCPKSKFTYYALSENAWGDGSKLDPETYLNESLDKILSKYNSFDGLAAFAKNSSSVNLIKIDEDCSYNTAFPNNRYQMLTFANPLYENLAIIRFNESGKLVEVIKHGVKKIYVETK